MKNKKKESINQRPDTYSSCDRLFIVMALREGGEDLDNFEVSLKISRLIKTVGQ